MKMGIGQILGSGAGIKNSTPNFWEWDRNEKFHSQCLGTRIKNCLPNFCRTMNESLFCQTLHCIVKLQRKLNLEHIKSLGTKKLDVDMIYLNN